jgi:hypothetical protein
MYPVACHTAFVWCVKKHCVIVPGKSFFFVSQLKKGDNCKKNVHWLKETVIIVLAVT